MTRIYKSGEKVPVSGQYVGVFYNGKTGCLYGKGYEKTCIKGNKFPPYKRFRKPILLRISYGYLLVDKTRHQR
jgi:hypothetical protein